MATSVLADRFIGVDSDAAADIRSRRERLGMTIKELAERAQVDRGRLSALENGISTPRPSTVGAIIRTLDELEREMGLTGDDDDNNGDDDLVTFEVAGNFGVKVIVKGPVRDRAELEDSVMRLISRMQQQSPPDPS